jgi:hypothetical protein
LLTAAATCGKRYTDRRCRAHKTFHQIFPFTKRRKGEKTAGLKRIPVADLLPYLVLSTLTHDSNRRTSMREQALALACR